MDAKFHQAVVAIKTGDLEGLKAALTNDPSLATARSSCSHPTLLQCLALDGIDAPNKLAMTRLLIEAGAEINGPLVAAASINNLEVLRALLDAGGAIEGDGNWSPLEEALYWGQKESIGLLLESGASVSNLRTAAGLGRVVLLAKFFNADGSLKPEAGKISWPFNDLNKESIQRIARQWSHEPRDIINNAFIYACMHNRLEAVKFLLEKGAGINAIPPGFDYAGTGLHYAALNGHRDLVEFLSAQGADPKIKDAKVGSTAAGWADHGDHPELKQYLEGLEQAT
jgi:uncharacterized protein